MPPRCRHTSSVIFMYCTNKYCNGLLPQRGVMRCNLLLLLMLLPHKSVAAPQSFPMWWCWAMEAAHVILSCATVWFHAVPSTCLKQVSVYVCDYLFLTIACLNVRLRTCRVSPLWFVVSLVRSESVVGTEINSDGNIHWAIRALHCQLVAAGRSWLDETRLFMVEKKQLVFTASSSAQQLHFVKLTFYL